jgi:putative PIN family toxin of toxin-antitoxin system
MRVIVDSNVIISAIVLKSKAMTELLKTVSRYHSLVLTSGIIEEVSDVVAVKFPSKIEIITAYIKASEFEYVPTSSEQANIDAEIRDPDDRRILGDAYLSGADVLITGDKDFFERGYRGLEILTPADFMKKYGRG